MTSPYVRDAAARDQSERDFWKSRNVPYGNMLLLRDALEQVETLAKEIGDETGLDAFYDLARQLGNDKEEPGEFIHDWVMPAERDLTEWLDEQDRRDP